MLRNLLYNCCPLIGAEDITRDNIEWLCKYASTFNNRKLVLIKTGAECEDPEVIRPLFAAFSPEFMLHPNDRLVGETAGFIETLELLESKREDEITFYAHSKGVSERRRSTERSKLMSKQWRDTMYRECLSQPAKIDEIMSKYAACGCYLARSTINRKDHKIFNIKYVQHDEWNFEGNFWWVNNRLFACPTWRNILPARYGVEVYLSSLFDYEAAYQLLSKRDNRRASKKSKRAES